MKMEWQLRDVGRASWHTAYRRACAEKPRSRMKAADSDHGRSGNVVSARGGHLKTNSGLLLLCRALLDTDVSDWLIQFQSVRAA